MGRGQNSLKTLPVWAYQGEMTCESMVRLLNPTWESTEPSGGQPMPYVRSQGLRIHYHVEGDGPPLVCQHGFGDSLESWYELGYVDALKDEYRLVLIDARGHGASDKPHEPEAYSFQNVTADVVAVLDALTIANAHYFGCT